MSNYFKSGDRFIIEIGDVFQVDITDKDGSLKEPQTLYRIKGFNSLVFDDNGLSKLKQIEDTKCCCEEDPRVAGTDYNGHVVCIYSGRSDSPFKEGVLYKISKGFIYGLMEEDEIKKVIPNTAFFGVNDLNDNNEFGAAFQRVEVKPFI